MFKDANGVQMTTIGPVRNVTKLARSIAVAFYAVLFYVPMTLAITSYLN